MKTKHLKGKGEFIYDFKYDILTFKVKGRTYKGSIEFQNFVIDIDKENYITGIRIMDASKVFNSDKYILKNIVNGEFKASTENKIITITLKFVCRFRNKIIAIGKATENMIQENFTQQITTQAGKHHLSDSSVEAATKA